MGLNEFMADLVPRRWKNKLERIDEDNLAEAERINQIPRIGPVPLGGFRDRHSLVGQGDQRTDEFAPFEGIRPTGSFAGDAPQIDNQIKPTLQRTDAPPNLAKQPNPLRALRRTSLSQSRGFAGSDLQTQLDQQPAIQKPAVRNPLRTPSPFEGVTGGAGGQSVTDIDAAYENYPGQYPGGKEAMRRDIEAVERVSDWKRRTGEYPDINKPVVPAAENPYDEIQVSDYHSGYELERNKRASERKYKLQPGMTGYKYKPVRANYRDSDVPADDPRVMARPVGNGNYEERLIGPDGRIQGFGDQRDPEQGLDGLISPMLQRNPLRKAMQDSDSIRVQPTTRPNDLTPQGGKDALRGQFQTEGRAQSDPSLIIRPRLSEVNPLRANREHFPDQIKPQLIETGEPNSTPFGSSGEPFRSTRPRRTQPRDFVADDAQYLRDLENQPRTKKDKFMEALRFASIVGTGIDPGRFTNTRGNKIARARNQLATDLSVEQHQAQTRNYDAGAYDKLNKPPERSTRVVSEGEYPGVPEGTEIRQIWNGREMVDAVGRDGRPTVSKAPAAGRGAAREIKYNGRGHAVLVPKDGGRATPIFEEDGTPLTKQANESGNVQTAYRLAPDGITEIQIERDDETGQWVDSIGQDKKPIVRGTSGRIDPTTGAPVSSVITENRLSAKERQENQRKRQSYEGEAKEWGGKETTFRQNKTSEDEAIRTKTAQLQALYQEQTGGYLSNRGGRTQGEIDVDKVRLQKEIETHRTNAAHFQTEADKAASAATGARRNAALYSDSGGSQGVIGRPPAGDGKHHYTKAEIRAQAEANGKSFDALYKILKANKNVVIDE